MSKHHQKLIRSLVGHFLGWGDERCPHRYIKLATASGAQTVKVAKSLRSQIPDWQPGISLYLLTQQRINRTTGKTTIKVKQLLTPPATPVAASLQIDLSSLDIAAANCHPVIDLPTGLPSKTEIRVCQGSSCRQRGSEGICRAMQAYLDGHDLADRVEIIPVKCLHQCKAAPQAIVISPEAGILPHKVHYRQIKTDRVEEILAKHLSVVRSTTSMGTD